MNQKADLASCRESNHLEIYINSQEKYKRGWKRECHLVPTPEGMTDTEFITKLLEGAQNYEKNSISHCFRFGLLFGPNCASWTNSLLNHAGVNNADRLRLGDFWGLDRGVGLLIDGGMWDPPKRNK